MSVKELPPDIDFKIPSWAGKPPNGLHLDVTKDKKLVQILMIDEKKCYFFGRNPQMCDFAVDHASCSRVHAALVYHKFLNRVFLVDLNSSHGTFIGTVRLEANKPEHVTIDQSFHFGASTRRYVLRERPDASVFPSTVGNEELSGVEKSSRFLGLPEKEEELETLTEYNTALNRRISNMTAITDDEFNKQFAAKRKRTINVVFKTNEDIINPEDIDPSVGRFRNMVQTEVIRTKRPRMDFDFSLNNDLPDKLHLMPSTPLTMTSSHLPGFGPISAKLIMSLPNSAPDVDLYPPTLPAPSQIVPGGPNATASAKPADDDEPKKKRYAKEAWPGKKSGQHLLI